MVAAVAHTVAERVYGLHAVEAALRAGGPVRTLRVVAGRGDRRVAALRALAESRSIPVHEASRSELDALAGGARHQGVVAELTPGAPVPADLDMLLVRAGASALVLVLDGVQDPHNLGACLRSADAAGVTAVVVPADRAAGLTPVVRKVACGAAEHVPFLAVTNLGRTLARLKDAGLWLVGAAGDASRSLYETDLTGPLALVLGSEERGLRRLTREACDFLVRIPMHGSVASLNVSVATGICLFEARRQRDAADLPD